MKASEQYVHKIDYFCFQFQLKLVHAPNIWVHLIPRGGFFLKLLGEQTKLFDQPNFDKMSVHTSRLLMQLSPLNLHQLW